MASNGRESAGRWAVGIAGVIGLVHAAWSVYWALGGRWLLPTVGDWAVDLVERAPVEAGVLLGAIGLVKLAAALIPIVVAQGHSAHPRFWRTLCWIGGPLLVVYGGVNVVVSVGVLSGVIDPDGGYDADAMMGHAYLWDPLFVLWGGFLVAWLRLSRS